MKILLLNYTDSGGGAAIAAHRLAHALYNAGHTVILGVADKRTDSFLVRDLSFTRTFFQKVQKRIYLKYKDFLSNHFKTSNKIQHSLNVYSKININDINAGDYDIIHLHWINNNMISVRDIARITKPIVWTMHDSWPFCGAEHHPNILEKDERFITGYSTQNKPVTTRGFDVCKIGYDLKKNICKNYRYILLLQAVGNRIVLKKVLCSEPVNIRLFRIS